MYKLDLPKLGCFEKCDVNNTLFFMPFVQTRPRSQVSPIPRGLSFCLSLCLPVSFSLLSSIYRYLFLSLILLFLHAFLYLRYFLLFSTSFVLSLFFIPLTPICRIKETRELFSLDCIRIKRCKNVE